ncbi:MAG: hypothetical protein ACU837_16290 [Gammaproteobacteria bacterium]
MKKNIIMILSLISCQSCTSTINFRITELELLERERTFSGHESTITVAGMLHAVIESDMELISYAKQHHYNILSYRVTGCSSGIRFFTWPDFYPKEPQANAGPYRYDVVFHYKNLQNSTFEVPYNLAKQPENLCFMVKANSMNPFSRAQSRIVEVPIDAPFIKKLRTFEAESGPIYFKPADYCKKYLCIPDYVR